MDKSFSNPLLAIAAGYNVAAIEARFLRWQFATREEAVRFASARKQAAIEGDNHDGQIFWEEVEQCLLSDQSDAHSSADLMSLIAYVDSFSPRDEWITPILRGVSCQDFRTQLLTAVEDYGEAN